MSLRNWLHDRLCNCEDDSEDSACTNHFFTEWDEDHFADKEKFFEYETRRVGVVYGSRGSGSKKRPNKDVKHVHEAGTWPYEKHWGSDEFYGEQFTVTTVSKDEFRHCQAQRCDANETRQEPKKHILMQCGSVILETDDWDEVEETILEIENES